MDETARNPWTRLSRRTAYRNPWITVTEDEVLTPGGRPGIYGIMSPNSVAVGCLPVDAEGQTWLVGQWRYPLDRYSWEIPEGGASKEVPPHEEALRELREETGLTAARFQELLRLDLSNAISDEGAVVFLVWDLTAGEAAPDETEDLRLRRLPVAEAIEMAHDGRITDAISVAALLRLEVLALRGQLPEGMPPVL
ncbi:NUDIX domain-containing protein [Caenispirillum salinarum]|uniref:NUDIX domain-containing protein n=1 Tax=Caenispirillum salinarum TaxID=859058 RepID=UPI00384C0582